MRTSKSRSRGKRPNNNRSNGNIMNRVFDSSGPEGKVRGTPQQIIEKYSQLYRDAQLSNDLVAAENFQQHAEHYARMLTDAQREQDARKEAAEIIQQSNSLNVTEDSGKEGAVNKNERGSFENNKIKRENSESNKSRHNGYDRRDNSSEEELVKETDNFTRKNSDAEVSDESKENEKVEGKDVTA